MHAKAGVSHGGEAVDELLPLELLESLEWLAGDSEIDSEIDCDPIPDWVLDAMLSAAEPGDGEQAGRAAEPGAGEQAGRAAEPGGRSAEPVRWAVPGVWDTPTPPAGPSGAMLALQEAADQVCAEDLRSATDLQAVADATLFLQIQQRLGVHQARRLADLDQRDLPAVTGHHSTRAWLMDTAPDADPRDLSFARRAQAYRAVNAALDEGDLARKAATLVVGALGRCDRHVDTRDGLIDGQPGEQVVEAVVRNVLPLVCSARLGLRDDDPLLAELTAATEQVLAEGGSQLERLEKAFVLLACHVPLRLLRPMLEELYLAIVPSELDRRNAEGDALNSVTITKRADGLGHRFTIEAGVELSERLLLSIASGMRTDPDNVLDTAVAKELREQGLNPYDPLTWERAQPAREAFSADADGRLEPAVEHPVFGGPRGRDRRMADGLNRALARFLGAGLAGTHQKLPVQIGVTVTEPALTGAPGALPAKTDTGQLVGRRLLRRWWCDSRVTAFVLSKGGRALRTIHAGRTLTAVERRAAQIEHGFRCAGVGCCRGSTREGSDPSDLVELRPHHVRRYADDGVTSLDETILICDTSHHDIHEGGRTIRLRDGRLLNEQGWVDEESLRLRDEGAPF